MSCSNELIERIKAKYKNQILIEDALETVQNTIIGYFRPIERKLKREIELSGGNIEFKYDTEDGVIAQLNISEFNKMQSIIFTRNGNDINVFICGQEEKPFDTIYLEKSIQYTNKYIYKSKKFGNFGNNVLDEYFRIAFTEDME